jgi:hypothetical protein
MIGQSHPILKTMVVAQRRTDFHAWAENDRMCELAQPGAAPRRSWPDLAAVTMVIVALALLLVEGSAAAEGASPLSVSSSGQESTRTITQLAEESLLDPAAARTASAARL